MGAIAVRSLEAGSDKGETELRLPLRLLVGLCGPYVVLLWLSCGSCVGLSLSSLPCLCLAFALSCLVFIFVLVVVLALALSWFSSSLLFCCLLLSLLVFSCLVLVLVRLVLA